MSKFIFYLSLLICVQGVRELRADNGQDSPFPPRLEADLSAGASAIYMLDFDSAQEHFERAIDLDPDHPAAYFFELMLIWYRLTYDSLMNRDPEREKLLENQAELTVQKARQFAQDPATRAVGYL